MGFIEVSDLVQIICNNLYIYQNDIDHLLIQVAGSPLQVLFRRHCLSAEPAVKVYVGLHTYRAVAPCVVLFCSMRPFSSCSKGPQSESQ